MMKNKRHTKEGVLVWITGLAGSGKTTLAREIYRQAKVKTPVVLLDGDELREIIGSGFGYTPEERKRFAFIYSRLCRCFVKQNITVICATISLYKEIHNWLRENIKNLLVIYLDVPWETLKKRDSKKIYLEAEKKKLKNVIGVDLPFDRPENPEFTIKNSKGIKAFLANAEKILKLILRFKEIQK